MKSSSAPAEETSAKQASFLASQTGRWVIPRSGTPVTVDGREGWQTRATLGREFEIRSPEAIIRLWETITRVIQTGRSEAFTVEQNTSGVLSLILVRPAREAGFAIVTRQFVDATMLSPPAELLKELFNLTVTEARVACEIARGLELNDIAEQRRNSLETVRGYVKNILKKTGCANQKQLTAKLSRLATLANEAGIKLA
jgi:DNA-binding CsgD family transcriptional regulator